ncbi:MAG: RluA family pseudouridine synthase [Holosporales bacterium]|jgi:23S rRNA pseudouridine955/2504/2580 synthase|nr:RluA family pseudouridine synthase [Holosporales bacterium]
MVGDSDNGRSYETSRLDRHIRRLYGKLIPQSLIEKALRRSGILVNGRKARAADAVSDRDRIDINQATMNLFAKFASDGKRQETSDIAQLAQLATQFTSMIVYEDDDLIIINKPSGLAVQLGSKMKLAVDVMAKAYNEHARLVHRIDKDTSGLVILAKNIETSRYMLELFQRKKIRKKYVAVVSGTVPGLQWRIAKPLLKCKEMVMVDLENGREAVTEFRVIKKYQSTTIVEAIPITGRTHQIRVHLASINCPIVGDGRYGGIDNEFLCLHAYEVSFTSRSGKHIKQQAEIPEYISRLSSSQ